MQTAEPFYVLRAAPKEVLSKGTLSRLSRLTKAGTFITPEQMFGAVSDPSRDAAQPLPGGVEGGDAGLVSASKLTAPVLVTSEGGGVVRLRVPYSGPAPKPGKRQKVKEFSTSSARNLRLQLAMVRNDALAEGILSTLSYPVDDIDLSDDRVFKRHLDRFTKAFSRKYPEASAFWRLEPTKRGFPHYHLIVLGIPEGDEHLQQFRDWEDAAWFTAVGTGLQKHFNAGCCAERVRGIEGARNYVAKYVSKQENQMKGFNGRYWGKINAAMIPWAPLRETLLTDYQAVKAGRVIQHKIETEVNERRFSRALRDLNFVDEKGWSRNSLEFASTLQGREGDAVWLTSAKVKILVGKKQHDGVTSPGWRHYWPEGVAAADLLKGQPGCVTDSMLPKGFRFPKKFRMKANASASFLGDADKFSAQLLRFIASFDPRPEYTRPKREEIIERRAKRRGSSFSESISPESDGCLPR